MLILSDVARLYDGTSRESRSVHEHVDLILDGERIVEVRPHRDVPEDLARREDVTVLDASSWTVTPGLVDAHGHVTVLGLGAREMDLMNTESALVYVERILHRTLVDGGVTTMRDIGGATHRMKALVEEGILLGPRLKIAICMLSTTGGHADFRGPDRCHGELSKLWPPAPGRPSSIVDGPWECRRRVREIAACGADLIKVCASPGVASPGDHLDHREFTPEELAAICDEAAARGLAVASHAHSTSGIQLAIEHGVHDIQHVSFLEERQVDLAYEKGCVVTPTSWVLVELLAAEGLSPFVLEKAKRAAEHHQRAVQYAASGDLPILAGTDPVLPGMHGRNYMELVHLVRDGLSPLAAWWGATGLAAREIGADDTGELVAGKRADLLILDADVIAEPDRFERPGVLLEVIQDGVGHRGLAGVPQRTFETTIERALPAAP